jgi:hypothetical protein
MRTTTATFIPTSEAGLGASHGPDDHDQRRSKRRRYAACTYGATTTMFEFSREEYPARPGDPLTMLIVEDDPDLLAQMIRFVRKELRMNAGGRRLLRCRCPGRAR